MKPSALCSTAYSFKVQFSAKNIMRFFHYSNVQSDSAQITFFLKGILPHVNKLSPESVFWKHSLIWFLCGLELLPGGLQLGDGEKVFNQVGLNRGDTKIIIIFQVH